MCMLNISSRGLLLQMAAPPAKGEYVEICRDRYVIIARTVWVNGRRFGVRTQDPLFIDAIINNPGLPGPKSGTHHRVKDQPERRLASRRVEDRHDRAKAIAKAWEFAAVVFFVTSVAMVTFESVSAALAEPLSGVRAALD